VSDVPSRPLPAKGRNRPGSGLEHLVFRRAGQAIEDFDLIGPGDRILVAVSGGKDSFALLHILDLHRKRAPFEFSLRPVFLDGGWEPGAADRVRERFARQGQAVEVFTRDIRGCVRDHLRPGTNPCALCARLRRGVLYDLAPAWGCNKIALGHHLDDLAQTLLLNLFYSGQLKSMAVKLRSDDGRNLCIRPLAYVEEDLLTALARQRGFEPIEIGCPYRTGEAEPRREMARRIIEQAAAEIPRIRRSILAALKHVRPTHLLDPALLARPGGPDPAS
jgi:tRNA 2-thiocytidine biosynthesis protein TtcA